MTQVEITKYKSSEGLISNKHGELRRKKITKIELSYLKKAYLNNVSKVN